MPVRGLNHLTLVTADLDRSLAFYGGRLGGRLRARGPRSAYLELGGLWLCLELGTPEVGRDDSHFALTAHPADLEGLADLPRWKENRSEGASLYLLDPDGRKLELHVGDLDSRLAHYRSHPDLGVTVHD